MKIRILSCVLLLLCCALPAAAQGPSRVALKGTAYLVSDNSKLWALEVGGKLVTGQEYINFATPDGKFFVATLPNGKKGICNAAGKFIYPCEYAQASVTGGTIVLRREKTSKPQFFSTANPTVAVQPKKMTIAQIEDQMEADAPRGTYFNSKRIYQREAIALALEMSDKLGLIGSYEIRDNDYGKQELVVDGKVYHTAINFFNATSIDSYAERNNCWYFIVKDRINGYDRYGLYCLQKKLDEQQIKVSGELVIPYDYDFITLKSRYKVRCVKPNFGGETTFTLGKATPESPLKVHNLDKSIRFEGDYVTLRIKSVERHELYTELKMAYNVRVSSSLFSGEPGTDNAFRLRIGDKVYQMLSCEGLFYERTQINSGESGDFSLRFEPIPEDAGEFLLMSYAKHEGWLIKLDAPKRSRLPF